MINYQSCGGSQRGQRKVGGGEEVNLLAETRILSQQMREKRVHLSKNLEAQPLTCFSAGTEREKKTLLKLPCGSHPLPASHMSSVSCPLGALALEQRDIRVRGSEPDPASEFYFLLMLDL